MTTQSPHIARRLFSQVLPYKWGFLIGMLAMFVTTGCMLILPQYLKSIFDEAIQQKNMAVLNDSGIWVLLTVLLLAVGMFTRNFCIRYSAAKVLHRLRYNLFVHVVWLDISYFESRSSGDVISRMLSDISVMREFFQFHFPMLVRGLLVTLGTLLALLLTNWKLTLTLCAIGLPIVVLAVALGKLWRGYSKAIQENFAVLSEVVEECVNGIRTVRVFGQETREIERFGGFTQRALQIAHKLISSNSFFLTFNIVTGMIAVVAVVWLGGRAVILDEMSLGEMMAFLLYLSFLGDGVGSLSSFWPALQSALSSTERVFELLDEKVNLIEKQEPVVLPVATAGREVKLENVSFAYGEEAVHVLQDVSFTAKPGETVALVGPSGAGKSTLFSLIVRFYDAVEGAVSLDGVNVKDLAFDDLRKAVCLVAQDPAIFSTSIRENIAYGRPDASDEEIEEAAKAANAHDFIMATPQGYDSPVGEKGVKLSGGQKQRLAIARTLLVSPSVLLLDEATSHLDAESEKLVQEALETLRQDRTMLVIAHRLSTVKTADRILVLDQGRVVAEGTHDQLLKDSPLYKNLAELQFLA